VITAFVLVACGIRAGWLLIALGSLGYTATIFANDPALAILGIWVFMVIASLYGWWAWRRLPKRVKLSVSANPALGAS